MERRIRKSFDAQSMMATLGASLQKVEPGEVWIGADLSTDVLQQKGFGHGGLAFTIGDSAAGYSALSLMDKGNEVLTIEMKINYLAPAAGDSLLAKGHVIRHGRKIVVVGAKVFAVKQDKEELIAILQGTMATVSA